MSLVYVAPDAKLCFIILSQLLLGKVFRVGWGEVQWGVLFVPSSLLSRSPTLEMQRGAEAQEETR